MPFIGDPWEEHEFEDMPQTGLHAKTGLGNSNQTASLTLEHLWSVMKPVYLKRLGRERQHGLIKVYFFMAFVYMKLYNTTAAWNKWFTWGPQSAIQCRVLQDIPNSDQANDLHDGGASRWHSLG